MNSMIKFRSILLHNKEINLPIIASIVTAFIPLSKIFYT